MSFYKPGVTTCTSGRCTRSCVSTSPRSSSWAWRGATQPPSTISYATRTPQSDSSSTGDNYLEAVSAPRRVCAMATAPREPPPQVVSSQAMHTPLYQRALALTNTQAHAKALRPQHEDSPRWRTRLCGLTSSRREGTQPNPRGIARTESTATSSTTHSCDSHKSSVTAKTSQRRQSSADAVGTAKPTIQQAASSSMHRHQAASCPASGAGHPVREPSKAQCTPLVPLADAGRVPAPVPAPAPLSPRPPIHGRVGHNYDACIMIRGR